MNPLRGAALALVLVLVTSAAIAATSASARTTASSDTLIALEPEVAPTLDPDGPDSSNPGLWLGMRNTYEPLIGYPTRAVGAIVEPNYKVGPMQFKPLLAQSYSHSGLTWTFKLRQGVMSCAGNELTADDVVYTFARAKSVSGATPVAWFLANVGSVLGVEPVLPKAKPAAKELHGEVTKVDKYTVRIKQTAPNELFPRVLEIFALDIFDSVEMKKHATAADPWSHAFTQRQGAAGYGPYCIQRWQPGTELVLRSNPQYYGGKPQFTNIVVRKVPTSGARIASIRTGAADIVTTLTPNEVNQLRKVSSVEVLSTYNNQSAFIPVNYAVAPFNLPKNELLRQAIAYALPYDDIIKADYGGHARRAVGAANIPSTYNGFIRIPKYHTDLAKAKQLLAQAGYPNGEGLDKYKSALTMYYPSERATIVEPVINRIRTALAKVGIPITLAPISQLEFANRTFAKRDLPMAFVDYGAAFGPDVSYGLQLTYTTKNVGNASNFSDPKFDALVTQTLKATGAKRRALMAQGQRIIMDRLPMIPVYEFESAIVVRKGLKGWLQTTDNALSFFYFKGA